MAKKKSARKRKTKKDQSSGNGFFIVIILIVVLGGIYFGLKKNGGGFDSITLPTFESTESDASSSQKQPETTTTQPQSKPEEKSQGELIDRSDLDAMDGKVEQAQRNKAIPTSTEESQYYFTSSFDFAWPTYSQKDDIIEHQYYALRYNEKTEQADWVAYKLEAQNLANAQYKRNDNFRPDPNASTQSAHPDDYKGSGYDRGHLAPAADFTWSKDGLDETFYMSNMSPQNPDFNRGIWADLENQVRRWAKSNGTIYVVTGPVFSGKNKKIGTNKVSVPERYYKVVLEMTGDQVKGIAFVLDNEGSTERLAEYAMSIDEAEKITGLDFFPLLPDDMESSIECCARYSDW